ncbi:MAG: TolC family protein [Flavobacteriales bacterium]|nr:TolC family protein [Flavobacteriales bacterium]
MTKPGCSKRTRNSNCNLPCRTSRTSGLTTGVLGRDQCVRSSNESVRYANERFEQGAVTALELSTAKANLNRSNADMITARYSYLMALKSLEIIQGIPLTL